MTNSDDETSEIDKAKIGVHRWRSFYDDNKRVCQLCTSYHVLWELGPLPRQPNDEATDARARARPRPLPREERERGRESNLASCVWHCNRRAHSQLSVVFPCPSFLPSFSRCQGRVERGENVVRRPNLGGKREGGGRKEGRREGAHRRPWWWWIDDDRDDGDGGGGALKKRISEMSVGPSDGRRLKGE